MEQRWGKLSPWLSWRRIDIATRWLFPFALLLFGFFVIGMPFGLPGQAELGPVYAMGCVYFWSLYRPASMPALLVAIAGLLLDSLEYSPFGMWAMLLLLLQATTLKLRQRLVPAPFAYVWAGFVVLAALGAALSWLFVCAFNEVWLPPCPAFIECLWAAGLYPALAAVLIRMHRGMAAIELV